MSQTGGHGDLSNPNDTPVSFGSCCSGTQASHGLVVDGVADCLRGARDLMRKGADHVKICVSNTSSRLTFIFGLQFWCD